MRELRTDILIEASAERVWQVLTDFSSYPGWNPFIRRIQGEVKEGSNFRVSIQPPDGKLMRFKPRCLRLKPNEEFRWKGQLLLPGLFDGEHIFEIKPLAEGKTRLVQREKFSGLLIPILWPQLDSKTRLGFKKMNEALKQRAEQL